MATLGRNEILEAKDLKKEEVNVPEWGGTVFIRTMRADERDAYELSCYDSREESGGKHQQHIRARLLVYTVCDEAGVRMFSEADLDALGAKSAKASDRLFAVAQKLNGIGDDDIEELEKN